MKIIGNANERGFIVEISREEMEALYVRPFSNPNAQIGDEVDVLSRLRPTLKFEQDALSAAHMVAHLREMAAHLEKGFASLREPNG
jgi:hypothetical protein